MCTGSRPCVLVVDDDEGTREALRLILESEGFDTVEAADGEQAIAVLRGSAGLPRAVVLDISMPKRDGVWVLEHKARDPALAAVPVIVWSAAGATSLPADAGVEAVLSKPAPVDRLVAEVKRAAGGSDLP
jgi:CheY-like chemotaxis protein